MVFGIALEAGLPSTSWPRGPSPPVDGNQTSRLIRAGDRFMLISSPHGGEDDVIGKGGDTVNIETDILGKYVEKLLNPGKGSTWTSSGKNTGFERE